MYAMCTHPLCLVDLWLQNYDAFLKINPADAYIAPVRVKSGDDEEQGSETVADSTGEPESLFFMDSVGGKNKHQQKKTNAADASETSTTTKGKRKQASGGATRRATKQKKST